MPEAVRSWKRRRGKPGEAVLETEVPSAQRLAVPPIDSLDAEGFRQLMDEVAGHKGAIDGTPIGEFLGGDEAIL